MGKASSQTTNYYSPKPAAPPQSCKTNEIVYNTHTKHMLASLHVCTLHAHTQVASTSRAKTNMAAKAQKGEGSRQVGSASGFSTQSINDSCSLNSRSTAG